VQLVLAPLVFASDLARPPIKYENRLILSTIHSVKGLEWDSVYLIHAADGYFPSDMATGNDMEIDEELRITYVVLRSGQYCTVDKTFKLAFNLTT
jgi:DNA helicase-2/ATP-dependent DNA helicase PcrA